MELEKINIKISGINDNISALQIASNGLRKIKHIELRYLFILEKIIIIMPMSVYMSTTLTQMTT